MRGPFPVTARRFAVSSSVLNFLMIFDKKQRSQVIAWQYSRGIHHHDCNWIGPRIENWPLIEMLFDDLGGTSTYRNSGKENAGHAACTWWASRNLC